ncbi:MAG: hypothetical protein LAO24_08620 [Acidobacteriia bacterium]|nr:hypothetical protein [Terriglobia bacterium]
MRGGRESVHPTITIRVSGKLFVGHLAYLDQLVQSAAQCKLWPLLNLEGLGELDRAALFYFINGEGHDFGIVFCPNFVQEWMDHERSDKAA